MYLSERGHEERMKYISDDKRVITLPVPLGSTLYQVATECGDFCLFQQERFDKIFPPTKEGRCAKDMPCHTMEWNVYKIVLKFSNIEFVLENWEKWVFPSEEAAQQRMKDVVESNRKKMQELGFAIREDGYSFVSPEQEGVESNGEHCLVFTSPRGKKITFAKYTDNRKNTVQAYTSYICPSCYNKYRGVLGKRAWRDIGLGGCCVLGCESESDMGEYGYVVDFEESEVSLLEVEALRSAE